MIPSISYGKVNSPKVYLITLNKLSLKDIETMDNLKRVIEEGSIGLMNTKGISGYTGVESFLTINSSEKTYGNYNCIDFEPYELDGYMVNKSISRIINLNKNNNYSPAIGAIGDNLHKIGLKTGIYGNSDLINMPLKISALIPMDSKGLVDYGNTDDITMPEKNYPFGLKTNYEKLILEIIKSPADFVVVDTGDLDRLFRYKENLSDSDFKETLERVLVDLDIFIGELINRLGRDNILLIFTSPNGGDINKLSPLILWGKDVEHGILTSSTTKREGIVSNLDIGPTVMKFLEAPNDFMAGNPIKALKKDINLQEVIKQNQQIDITSKVRYNTLYYYGILSMIIFSLGIFFFIAKINLPYKFTEVIRTLFTTIIVLPNIFIILSLFKIRGILTYLFILLLLTILCFIILWKTKNIKNQILFISFFSIILIGLDLILKGHISKYSVLSHDPIIGARYYGIGNEMVGLFLGSITIFSTNILEKKKKVLIPLILYIISIIFIGHPYYGANVGGTMALIVTTFIYIMGLLNKDLGIKRILSMIILIVILLSIMGYIDIRFSKDITHLGKVILQIRDRGFSYLNLIFFRKILVNIKLVGRSFWTYLLFVHMIFYATVFNLYEEKNKNSLIGLMAGLSGTMAGFFLNNSGLILGAISMNLITAKLYIDYLETR